MDANRPWIMPNGGAAVAVAIAARADSPPPPPPPANNAYGNGAMLQPPHEMAVRDAGTEPYMPDPRWLEEYRPALIREGFNFNQPPPPPPPPVRPAGSNHQLQQEEEEDEEEEEGGVEQNNPDVQFASNQGAGAMVAHVEEGDSEQDEGSQERSNSSDSQVASNQEQPSVNGSRQHPRSTECSDTESFPMDDGHAALPAAPGIQPEASPDMAMANDLEEHAFRLISSTRRAARRLRETRTESEWPRQVRQTSGLGIRRDSIGGLSTQSQPLVGRGANYSSLGLQSPAPSYRSQGTYAPGLASAVVADMREVLRVREEGMAEQVKLLVSQEMLPVQQTLQRIMNDLLEIKSGMRSLHSDVQGLSGRMHLLEKEYNNLGACTNAHQSQLLALSMRLLDGHSHTQPPMMGFFPGPPCPHPQHQHAQYEQHLQQQQQQQQAAEQLPRFAPQQQQAPEQLPRFVPQQPQTPEQQRYAPQQQQTPEQQRYAQQQQQQQAQYAQQQASEQQQHHARYQQQQAQYTQQLASQQQQQHVQHAQYTPRQTTQQPQGQHGTIAGTTSGTTSPAAGPSGIGVRAPAARSVLMMQRGDIRQIDETGFGETAVNLSHNNGAVGEIATSPTYAISPRVLQLERTEVELRRELQDALASKSQHQSRIDQLQQALASVNQERHSTPVRVRPTTLTRATNEPQQSDGGTVIGAIGPVTDL